jgi:O-antigen ligase
MEVAMPKMTIAWVFIYVMALLASFVNPLYGTLGYLFEYYLRPPLHWWGAGLPSLRWNLTIAIVLAFTYFLRRGSLPNPGPVKRGPAMCLVSLLVVMILVLPISVNKSLSWEKTVDYSKLILFHGLAVGTMRTEFAFDAFVVTHMAGAWWWGLEAYRNPRRSAGRLANVGSGDSRGDNGTAAHLLTVLPFLAVYGLVHRRKSFRMVAIGAAPFVINTIILCNSRGAMLAMAVTGLVALPLARSGHRMRMAGAGLAFAVAFYVLADPQFIARQQNPGSYEDGSAQGRLEAWRGGLRLIADHPFGTGGQGFAELSPQYASALVERMGAQRDPHNTVVLVAAEWGILGLFLYLGYYAVTYLLLADVRKRAVSPLWFYRSVAVQLSMVGIFVAGLFTDRLYSEAPYWMGALAVALHRLHTYELSKAAPAAAVEPAAEPVRVRVRQAV